MNDPQEPYKLPHDIQELNRLDIQHRMWSLFFGGLYPSELGPIVEHRMTLSKPTVMDVGCGSGIWAIEMAARFPQSEVVGVDITPLKYKSTPPNFTFKQRNLIEGLPDQYTGQFDIIHCRCVCQHMQEPQRLVDDLVRCLKPGGLVIIPEGEWKGFDEDRNPLAPFVYNSELSIEENLANMRKLSAYAGWLAFFGKITRSPKYHLPGAMLKNTDAVKGISFREYWAPTGWPGKGVLRGEEVGAVTRLNMKEFFQTSAMVMISHGIPVDVVDALRDRAIEELEERRHNVWYCTSAVALEAPMSKS